MNTAALLLLVLAQTPASRAQTECKTTSDGLQPAANVTLPQGGWTAAVHARLTAANRALALGSAQWSPCKRPLAVFAWNGALDADHIGQAAVDLGVKRSMIDEAHSTPCKADGKVDCKGWRTRAFEGQTRAELEAFAAEVPTRIQPEVAELLQALVISGWDVFIVTSSAQWLVTPHAAALGLSSAQVIGTRTLFSPKGVATDGVRQPLPFGAGKVIATRTRIAPGGRRPALVVGAGEVDRALLDTASHLAVLLGPAEASLSRFAKARGWAIQAAF